MRRQPVIIVLAAVLAAALAVAATGGAAHAGEKPGDPGTNIDMPILMAPMSKDGQLLGYAYVTSVLVATSPRAALIIRDKLAFIQDGFVRDVNAAPIALASDPTKADRALLANRLLAVARRIVGADKVARINFSGGRDAGIAFAPMHPDQALQPVALPTVFRRATPASD